MVGINNAGRILHVFHHWLFYTWIPLDIYSSDIGPDDQIDPFCSFQQFTYTSVQYRLKEIALVKSFDPLQMFITWKSGINLQTNIELYLKQRKAV